MLRLEKMEIVGFKSFGDRTEVSFPEGITAVVGPNGCGKSNIGDAINWVLGEQSAKMLRGSHMEDVIFNGSENRKPMGMAEVSLQLSGTNGTVERREVLLTRRLYRSGESEYLVNGQRARLKDIQEILREAHVGAKTYATIEQGRIDQILNAKPKERRLIIEDAAGIFGFKQKRRLTEMKLEATQANLLRVNDILAEVRRQINALKRQAARARRYRRLREALRQSESVRFALRARDLDAELQHLLDAERRSRDTEAGVAAGMAGLEAQLAAERQETDESARELQTTRETLHQLEIRISEEESRIRLCRERVQEGDEGAARLDAEAIGLATREEALEDEARALEAAERVLRSELETLVARLAGLELESEGADRRLQQARQGLEEARRHLFESMNRAADARNRLRVLEEAIERNVAQAARREAERTQAQGDFARVAAEAANLQEQEAERRRALEGLEAAHAAAAERLANARNRLATEIEDLSVAREREQSVASRLRTLEDVSTRFAGVSDGVRALLSAEATAGVRTKGVVADYLSAGPDIEAAAENYLQTLLPAVIVEDDADACAAAALLRDAGAGRTALLCRNHPVGEPAVGSGADGTLPPILKRQEDPRVLGRLRDRLILKGGNGFLRDRIGDAVLVDSLDSALHLHREYPGLDYLTSTGEVVYSSGLIAAGGRSQAEHGLLAHARKIHEARAEHADASARVSEHQARVDASRDELSSLEDALAHDRQHLEESRRSLVELAMRAERVAEETTRTVRTAEILGAELDALADEGRDLGERVVAGRQEVLEAEQIHAAYEREIQTGIGETEALEADLRRLSEEVSSLRAEVAVRRQALAAVEKDRARGADEIAELRARIEVTRSDAAASRGRSQEALELLQRTETDLLDHLREREELAARLAAYETALAERRESLQTGEERLRALRIEIESVRESVREAELSRARAESDRAHLDDLCLQELGVTASDAAVTAGEALEDAEPELLDRQIVELRDRIEKIGPVNMMAIEEFTELEQRHTFLSAQQKDLEDSMASLRETIRRINSTSRERFLQAFEQIRTSYQEIFRVLFGGGRADLRLEEGEDVLECGVEILAQPPGKKLASVQLMSGGEKAMAAIALLFAIFRHQPSPFCLLDEVDAALDDVNVNRFTRMLREYSTTTQFVMITHNKLSMDSANLLYGVTMDEPGVSRVMSLKLD